MADRRASGVTAPAYQLYGPDAIEQALVPTVAGPAGSGVFAPATLRYALQDARNRAGERQDAYGGALDMANRRAMAIAAAENEASLNEERLKQVGGILQKDPTLLGALNSGELRAPGLNPDFMERFARIGLMDRLAGTYKTTGEGAREFATAGQGTQLPQLNTFLNQGELPQSETTVPLGERSAAAGNPTQDTIQTQRPGPGGAVVTQTQRVGGTRTPGQSAAAVAGQNDAISAGTGQGEVLSAPELTAIRQQFPGAQVDSRVGVNQDGTKYVTIKPKGVAQAYKIPLDAVGKVDIVVQNGKVFMKPKAQAPQQ